MFVTPTLSHIIKKLRHYAPFLPLVLLASYLASYAIWEDSLGSIVTTLHTGWGDMLVHIRAAIFYAEQGIWPHESFLLSGEAIGYSFFTDLLSSWLWKAGTPLALSFALPTILLVVLFFGLFEWIVFKITNSKAAAIISPLLFMGFGGLSGFITLIELQKNVQPWYISLRDLPYEVTAWHDQGIVILNPFIMMLHQRAYLLGFPLFILALYLGFLWFTKKSWPSLALLTAVAIALAFTHPFTWITLVMILPAWFLLTLFLRITTFTKQDSLLTVSAWVIIASAGFLVIHSLQPSAGSSFLSWHPGWLATEYNWVVFWIRNIGLHILLIIWATYHLWRTHRPLAALVIASSIPFIAGNLWLFAPWAWDNTKIFAPVWLIGCIAVGTLLGSWWENKYQAWKALVIFAIAILTLSGVLEITRAVVYVTAPMTLTTSTNELLGKAVREISLPSDIILTATNPDHPVFMHSGRPSFTAYEGWLWSQGWKGKYEQRITDSRTIYAGGDKAFELLRLHHIAFVVIGPAELQAGANQSWFDLNYPLAVFMNGYRVYTTR